MKLVVLTGIPGSGSTTVLKKTLEEVDYLHLNYGDIMTEIAVETSRCANSTMSVNDHISGFGFLTNSDTCFLLNLLLGFSRQFS